VRNCLGSWPMKFNCQSEASDFPSAPSPSTGWKFSFLALSETTLVGRPLDDRGLRHYQAIYYWHPLSLQRQWPWHWSKSPLETSAPLPIAVFLDPVVLLASALTPVAVLFPPVVLLSSAKTPLEVFAPARGVELERTEPRSRC